MRIFDLLDQKGDIPLDSGMTLPSLQGGEYRRQAQRTALPHSGGIWTSADSVNKSSEFRFSLLKEFFFLHKQSSGLRWTMLYLQIMTAR